MKSAEIEPPMRDEFGCPIEQTGTSNLYEKFFKFDKLSLRFQAKMKSTIAENSFRSFIVSYHLSDDTMSVFENTDLNAGFKVAFTTRNTYLIFLKLKIQFFLRTDISSNEANSTTRAWTPLADALSH